MLVLWEVAGSNLKAGECISFPTGAHVSKPADTTVPAAALTPAPAPAAAAAAALAAAAAAAAVVECSADAGPSLVGFRYFAKLARSGELGRPYCAVGAGDLLDSHPARQNAARGCPGLARAGRPARAHLPNREADSNL